MLPVDAACPGLLVHNGEEEFITGCVTVAGDSGTSNQGTNWPLRSSVSYLIINFHYPLWSLLCPGQHGCNSVWHCSEVDSAEEGFSWGLSSQKWRDFALGIDGMTLSFWKDTL